MNSIEDIPLIGGDLALDFVNTAEQRNDPTAREFLVTPQDLDIWGRRAGILNGASRASDTQELSAACDARELIHALLSAHAAGRPPQRPQLDALGRLAAEAYARGTLQPADAGRLRWQWSPTDPRSIRDVAVTRAVLLLSATGTRLKQCPGEHCGWLFLDTTKRGNRRWCSMSECGQDAKDEARRLKRQRTR